jgi:orotate phosphoribosyltransferase
MPSANWEQYLASRSAIFLNLVHRQDIVMQAYQRDFIRLAIEYRALRFGLFTLKSGRVSPYFFNAGLFNSGRALAELGRYYAAAVVDAQLDFDVLFGPAYKGIALAATTAIALADNHGLDRPYAFNRKEVKDHGEGGTLVGAPLVGKVLIIDDVMTAGTAVREVIDLIRARGAQPAGVVIGLNRQERGSGRLSALQEVEQEFSIPVISIAAVDHIIAYLEEQAGEKAIVEQVRTYRKEYGAGE